MLTPQRRCFPNEHTKTYRCAFPYAVYAKGEGLRSPAKSNLGLKVFLTPYGQVPCVRRISAKTTVGRQLTGILPDLSRDDPVLIDAGTGFGKTSGVLESIIIPEHERRKACSLQGAEPPPSVWFISSRSALNLQFKQRLAKAVEAEHLLTERTVNGLLKEEVFGPVRVMTYHALWNRLRAQSEKLDVVEYLVFDEVHSLVLDSTFVGFTGELLRAIPYRFRNAKRIYLSATPEPVIPCLTAAECPRNVPVPADISRRITVYRWPKKFDQFRLHFYRQYENISSYIQNLPEDEKMLIFVPSIAQGTILLHQIPHDSILITAETRREQPELWEKLLSGEPLPFRFLISTLTLDAGISITDPALKHIVCSGLDAAEVLQQAGRRWLKPSETLNLYLWSPDKKHIGEQLYRVQQQLRALEVYESDYSMFMKRFILSDGCAGIRELCSVTGSRVVPNDLAIEYLKYQGACYQALLDCPDRWPQDRVICRAFHQKLPEEKSRWLDGRFDGDPQEDLRLLLKETKGNLLDKQGQKNFSQKFKQYYQAAFGKRANDRTDREWGISVIKKMLGSLNWGFTMESERGVWRLLSIYGQEEASAAQNAGDGEGSYETDKDNDTIMEGDHDGLPFDGGDSPDAHS